MRVHLAWPHSIGILLFLVWVLVLARRFHAYICVHVNHKYLTTCISVYERKYREGTTPAWRDSASLPCVSRFQKKVEKKWHCSRWCDVSWASMYCSRGSWVEWYGGVCVCQRYMRIIMVWGLAFRAEFVRRGGMAVFAGQAQAPGTSAVYVQFRYCSRWCCQSVCGYCCIRTYMYLCPYVCMCVRVHIP